MFFLSHSRHFPSLHTRDDNLAQHVKSYKSAHQVTKSARRTRPTRHRRHRARARKRRREPRCPPSEARARRYKRKQEPESKATKRDLAGEDPRKPCSPMQACIQVGVPTTTYGLPEGIIPHQGGEEPGRSRPPELLDALLPDANIPAPQACMDHQTGPGEVGTARKS